ncbi:MAG TPA: hypothetical protein VK154_11080 [Chitinophagales bacterium]|nr:hypothetical protein [Chitinophagales bacterium]
MATFAQPDGKFKEWGQVTLADLNLTECSFEKDADAMLLLDLGDVFFKESDFNSHRRFKITSAYYQRFKIFTERGIQRVAFNHRYNADNAELISNVKAACYNLENGQIVKTTLMAEDVHYNQLDHYETEVSFTVPNVKKGSVVEIYYTTTQFLTQTLSPWYFHNDIPCLKSTLRIGFLDSIEYYVKKQITHKQYEETNQRFAYRTTSTSPSNGEHLSGNMVTYSASNLPAVVSEPHMNSRINYLDHLYFQLKAYHAPVNYSDSAVSGGIVSSWPMYNTFILKESQFGQHLNDSGIPRKVITELLKSKQLQNAAPQAKAKAIFDFVQKSMTCNYESSGDTWPDNSETWKLRSGNSSAINLLLLNALRQEGITANPMLVGLRNSGYVYKDYPIWGSFRSVIVVIEQAGKEKILLDASEKFIPFGLPPYNLLNNNGYIFRNPKDVSWYYITSPVSNDETAFVNVKLDSNGLAQGEIKTRYNNYSQDTYRSWKAETPPLSIFKDLRRHVPDVTVDQLLDSVEEKSGLYTQTVNFSIKPTIDKYGKIYISMSSIFRHRENEFTSERRRSDVDLGFKQNYSTIWQLEIPKGYVADSLPKPAVLQTSDTTIRASFTVEQTGQTLLMRQKLEYRKSLYPAADYSAFYDFHQKYYKLIQQPVVLRKKE